MDANELESLFEDSPESVLYGFQQNVSARFLGNHFRADDGKTHNYIGPWFDIYEVRLKSKTQPGNPFRTKLYNFDSATGWLVKVTAPNMRVTTEFSGWAKTGSDAFPQKIIRTEAGATVFTINITQAVAGPSIAADGVFPGH
jgi:hypothetical protein